MFPIGKQWTWESPNFNICEVMVLQPFGFRGGSKEGGGTGRSGPTAPTPNEIFGECNWTFWMKI